MKAFVGLGANLGDARGTLGLAIQALAKLPDTALLSASSVYRSAPVAASGGDYFNAVVALATGLQPASLLQALQRIEAEHGRQRPYANAPRTLDLDLLLVDDRVINEPQLQVPHPRLHERAFVLQPLLEIAPDAAHPQLGPLAPYLAQTAQQRIEKLK